MSGATEQTRAEAPFARVAEAAARSLDEVEKAVVGKGEVLELVLSGLLADGHVLSTTYSAWLRPSWRAPSPPRRG